MSALSKFEEALKSWPKGQRHTQVMRCANLAVLAGIPQGEAVGRITAAMPRPPDPLNEVEATAAKAYAESTTRDATAKDEPIGWDDSIGWDRPKAAPPVAVQVSFYASKTDRTGASAPIAEVLGGIKGGRWAALVAPVRSAIDDKAKTDAKGSLPAFTPGGLFAARKKDGLFVHSGFVVGDIDGLTSEAEAAKVRDTLAQDAYVQAAFISPSGLGVKALVRVDRCADAADHEAAFAALVGHFKDRHGINLDTSGKDVSRLCFVSHDPGAFIRKGKALPFTWREPEADDGPQIVSARDFMAVPIVEPPQVIRRVLRAGQVGLLAANSKAGKTWLMQWLALAMPNGIDWLGWETTPGRVLYVDPELPPFDGQSRLATLAKAMGLDGMPDGLDLWRVKGTTMGIRDMIPKIMRRQERNGEPYALILLDSLYCLGGGRDENDNAEQAKTMQELYALTAMTGAAVLVTHHFSKGNKSQTDHLDRASGAGVFARAPDIFVTMTSHKEENCYSVETTCRSFAKPPGFVVRWEYPLWKIANELNPDELKRHPGAGRSAQYTPGEMVDLLPGEGLTHGEWKKLAEDSLGMKSSAFNTMLGRVKADKLVALAFGKYTSTGGGFEAGA